VLRCVFYRGSLIFISYTDVVTALDIDSKNLDNFIQVQEPVDAKLKVEAMCHSNNYVGVKIQHQSDGTFHFVQTALIDQIIADCGLTKSTKKKQVPAKSSKILSAHLEDSPKFDGLFGYCSCTLVPSTSSDPRKEHGAAILDIAMYLKFT
ncbi:hypothetical protein ACHAWF_009909, partial [Thalassiosira exigua]